MCNLNSPTPQGFFLKLLPPHCAQNYHSLGCSNQWEKKATSVEMFGQVQKGQLQVLFQTLLL